MHANNWVAPSRMRQQYYNITSFNLLTPRDPTEQDQLTTSARTETTPQKLPHPPEATNQVIRHLERLQMAGRILTTFSSHFFTVQSCIRMGWHRL